MHRKKWNLIAAAALVFAVAANARAADSGFYAIASLGQGDENPKSSGTNVGSAQGVVHVDAESVEVDDGGIAWGVGLGYRINAHVSAQLEYLDFGTTDVREHYNLAAGVPFPFPATIDLDYSSKVTGPAVSLLGTLPVGKDFELFVRGGLLFASRDFDMGGSFTINGSGNQAFADRLWLAGVGADWSFAQRWAARAEYLQTGTFDKTITVGETKVKRLGLSLLYRF